jgi:hypothetical protein
MNDATSPTRIAARETACVVLANAHNPTILNHDWLARTGIIADETHWVLSEPPIVTPGFARLAYENGITITSELNKLTIADTLPGQTPRTIARDLCISYIERLSHVPYAAVGINFVAAVERPNATETLVRSVLKDGPWKPKTLAAFQLKLSTPLSDRSCTRNLDIGALEAEKLTDHGLVAVQLLNFAVNYHRDALGNTAAVRALQFFEDDLADFTAHIADIAENIT